VIALLIIPIVAACAYPLLASSVADPRPDRTAVFLTITAIVVALATTMTLSMLAWPLVARIGFVAHLGGWQPDAVGRVVTIPTAVSMIAIIALLVLLARATRLGVGLAGEVARLVGAHRALASSAGTVVLVDDPRPVAHAAPSLTRAGGKTLVSAALVDLLDDDEYEAVLAHERAHLDHHHHLFAVTVDLAAALNPLLRPIARRTRFELERSADEHAASQTSRRAAARALAKIALARLDHQGDNVRSTMALRLDVASHPTTDRVEALLRTSTLHARTSWPAVVMMPATIAVIAAAWAASSMEGAFEAVRLLH
jgi:Zn-dependent protease with chaperone function